jgi:hypothetical protein
MSGAGVKTVHLIVHGQKKLLEQVKAKLGAKGSKEVRCGQQVLNGQEIKEILSRWFGPLLHLRRSLLVRSRGLTRVKVRTKGLTLAPKLPLAKRSYIEYLFNDAFFPREEQYYLKKRSSMGMRRRCTTF